MKRRDFIRTTGTAAAGAGVLSACGGDRTPGAVGELEAAVQGPEISWRMASSFPESLDILHGAAERLADRVRALTGGRFDIRVYAAGEIVPGLQVMDAVQQGSVQAGFTTGYYYIGKSPALAFDSAVPFGLTTRQQNAWLWHGGGMELLRDVYADFGVIQFPAGNTGAQMGGWFRRPVNSLADLRGLRMRIPGMGGQIMTRLGVSVQGLSGAEIYPALERGAIDATEWVGPHDDLTLGFHAIASYYYMPGWWEPGLSGTLQLNLAAWNALPEAYQELLATVSKETQQDMLNRYDAANPIALNTLVNEHGVQLRVFSDDILEAAWNESNAYLEEQAAADAAFRRVYESWRTFRNSAFPYFGGNELHYARFAFAKIPGNLMTS